MDRLAIEVNREAAQGFCELLDDANVSYDNVTPRPKPGVIYASAMEYLALDPSTTIPAAVAGILIHWIRAKSRRKITIITQEHKVINVQAEGYSVEELSELLQDSKRVTLLDIPEKKPPQIASDDAN